MLLEVGIEHVWGYVDGLVDRLLTGIDRSAFHLVSSDEVHSSLVLIEPVNERAGVVVDRLAAAGVHVAQRRGRIRISPHLYNTPGEIDRALDLL
jgi:selenocysteine lyase/cysteine desulfurase